MKSITDFIQAKSVVGVIDLPSVDQVLSTVQLLANKNITTIELTLRQRDVVIEATKQLAQNANIVMGIGTITNIADFDLAISLGAEYIVSPGINENLINHWLKNYKHQVAYLPGVFTPSEIMTAVNYGIYHLKFFPSYQQISHIKILQGPFADVKFCATGGTSANTKDEFLALDNVFAIGISKNFEQL